MKRNLILVNLLTVIFGVVGLFLGYKQYYGGIVLLINHLILTGNIWQFVTRRVYKHGKTKESMFVTFLIAGCLLGGLIGILAGTMEVLQYTANLIDTHSMTILIGFVLFSVTILDSILIVAIGSTSKYYIYKKR